MYSFDFTDLRYGDHDLHMKAATHLVRYKVSRSDRVPTRTGKPGKMGKDFEQTGKVRENDTKHCKSQEISEKGYLLFPSDI